MRPAPVPVDDAARLAALRRYDILDSGTEKEFDRVVTLAAALLDAPIAYISLVDEERQWIKACVGVELTESARSTSLCGHAILSPEVTVIPDAALDPRFADNPSVTDGIGIRFYAGAPLTTSDGYNIGTLCAVDTVPRPRPDSSRLAAFRDLAAMVVSLIETRQKERLHREYAARRAMIITFQQSIATARVSEGKLLERILEGTQELTAAAGSAIEIVEGDEIVYRAAGGTAAPHVGLRLRAASSLSGRCALSGEVFRCDDGETDERVDRAACRRVGVRSMIVVPLRLGDGERGALKVLSPEPNAFDDDDVETLQLMAGLIAAAMIAAGQRRMEAALLEERARSYRKLRRAFEELERAKDAAEAADRAKSEFLSRMSHELRTPLNAILGFAQLLSLDEGLDESQRDSVGEITTGGRHLLTLIDEVLDIARIEAGKMSISLEPVPLQDAADEVVSMFGPTAAAAGIDLRAEFEPDEVYVWADRQRVKQIIVNLVSNAVKYTPRGGRVVVATTSTADGRPAIEVSDTGVGMTAEEIERAFLPFERLGRESSDVEGTGLGLALARSLACAMQARLLARSEAGTGSTFTLELRPAREPSAEERGDGSRSTTSPRPTAGRILYVEDNPSNRRLVERLLERSPEVTLLTAADGETALGIARDALPDLVLLDVNLPGIPGREVLVRLRSDPKTRGIPVVVMSADATDGQVKRMLDAGAEDYLTKPIDVKRFYEIVYGLLGGGTT